MDRSLHAHPIQAPSFNTFEYGQNSNNSAHSESRGRASHLDSRRSINLDEFKRVAMKGEILYSYHDQPKGEPSDELFLDQNLMIFTSELNRSFKNDQSLNNSAHYESGGGASHLDSRRSINLDEFERREVKVEILCPNYCVPKGGFSDEFFLGRNLLIFKPIDEQEYEASKQLPNNVGKPNSALPSFERETKNDSSIISRIERVIGALFGNIKGILTLFGGVNAVNYFVFSNNEKLGSTKNWFAMAEDLRLQVKEASGLMGIINIRKAIYDPATCQLQRLHRGWSCLEILVKVNTIVNGIALPVITALGLLAGKGLILGKKEGYLSPIPVLSVIGLCSGLYGAYCELDNNVKDKKRFKTAQIVYDVAIQTFNCAMNFTSSTGYLAFALQGISKTWQRDIPAFDSLYRLAIKVFESWQCPAK